MIDKYGNDLDYWYYCPICASSYLPSFNTCPNHKKITLVKSQHPTQYYNHKSVEEYCLKKDAYGILWEEKLEERERKEKVSLYDIKLAAKNQCSAKCPTCGSTNVHKISGVKKALHGYAFGLFSKTARSQFECNNCGYKW